MNTEDTAIPFRLSPLAEGDAPKRVVPHPTDEYLTRQALLTDPAKVGDEESRAAAQQLAKEMLTAQTIAEMPDESFGSDEEKTAAASKIVELMTGEKDYDGRLWNGGTGFKTGADYLRSVKETLTRGMGAAADPDLQAWLRMSDKEKDALVESQRGILSHVGEAAGDIASAAGEAVRGVPRLSKDEYESAPKDVREASDWMGSVMWDTFEEKERAEYEAKVRDWRGGEWQRLKRRSEYEAKLRRKNALLYLPDMIKSLQSDDAKALAGELSQNPSEMPRDWTARLEKLPTRDIETLAQIRGMTREHVEGGFFNWLGDTAIGAYNGAHGLLSGMGAQEAKIAAMAMGWDGEKINEMINRKHALWSAYAGWSSPVAQLSDEHGKIANFTIGLASAVPFIASMHLKGMGYLACASEAMSEADAQAAAAGIDVSNPAYCARNALAGGLYAYMLKAVSPKFLGASATGASEEMALRTAFMKGVMSGITKLDTVKVMSQRTASGALMMAMQQGIAAVNEDLNLGGDAWRDAGQRFTETFISSIPDMLAFSAHGVLAGHARASGGWRKMLGAEGRANRSQNLREAVENAFAVRTGVDGNERIDALRTNTMLAQIAEMRRAWAEGGEKGLGRLGLKQDEVAEAAAFFEAERKAYGAAERLDELERATDAESLEDIGEDAPLGERNEAERKYNELESDWRRRSERMYEIMRGKTRDVPGTIRDLEAVRNVWAQGNAVGAGKTDGTDAGAAALVKAGFAPKDAEALSKAFGAERRGMYSPSASEALRALYTRSTRGRVEAHAALASAFGGRVRTIEGRTYIDLPMPDGGTGTLAVETVDLSQRFYGESGSDPEMARQVERATGGTVKADDWIAMDDAARREIVNRHNLMGEGDFQVTDPADPSLHISSGDADAVMGVIRLDPTADPGAAFHEAMHGILRFCQETGFFDDADLKWLIDTYGKPENPREQLNEENAADGFRQYLAKRMAGAITDEPGPFRKLFGLIGRLRHLRDNHAATERLATNAEEALYDAFLAGKYQHIRDLSFAEPTAPKAETGTGTEAPQTGAPLDKSAPTEQKLVQPQVQETQSQTAVVDESGATSQKLVQPTAPQVVRWEAQTPRGNKYVGGYYKVFKLSDIIHSNDPRYQAHAALQGRNRVDNKREEAERGNIKAEFNGKRYLDNATTSDGAPLVAMLPDNDGVLRPFVLSGNGRVLVLNELAKSHLYDRYRNPLKEWAEKNGVAVDVADADNPVLVRVMDDMKGSNLLEISRLSNVRTSTPPTESELARTDAEHLRSLDLANLYRPNVDGSPDMTPGVNDEFFRLFAQGPDGETIFDEKNNVGEDAQRRVMRAFLHLAVGDSKRGLAAAQKLITMSSTYGIDRQKGALQCMAPGVARTEGNPDYAIGPDVARAIADFMDFTEMKRAGKVGKLDDYIAQGDMFDQPSEIATDILRTLAEGKGTARDMAERVNAYSEIAKLSDADGGLGGAANARSRADIWREAKGLAEKRIAERDFANRRYSIAGKVAASNMGIKGAGDAEAMEKAGKDREEIWRTTGWWRGKDGRWRFELPSVKMKGEKEIEAALREGITGLRGGISETTLEKVLDAPALFEAYPRLKKTKIVFSPEHDDKTGGWYDAAKNEIVLLDTGIKDLRHRPKHEQNLYDTYQRVINSDEFLQNRFSNMDALGIKHGTAEEERALAKDWIAKFDKSIQDENAAMVRDLVKDRGQYSTFGKIVHEIQHAVQYLETFAKGGNPESADAFVKNMKRKQRIWAYRLEVEDMAKQLGTSDPYKIERAILSMLGVTSHEQIAGLEAEGWIPDQEGRDKGYNLYARGYDKEGYEESYNEYLGEIRKNNRAGWWEGTPHEIYRRLAGEVEARNASRREAMTPEERAVTPPWETEDVPGDRQIIRYSVSGTYKPRSNVPAVRGGWNEKKILRYLKANPSLHGVRTAARLISEFDTVDELKDHMFYHGTRNYVDKMQPSMTQSERWAQEHGGGGYGQRYWGISVSKSKKVASNFGNPSPGVSIYPVVLAKGAKVIDRPDLTDAADVEDHIVELWNDGVDAVRLGDWKSDHSEQELLVLNPRAICNIGTADSYRYFRLGSEGNPLDIKDDAHIARMLEAAKEYAEYSPSKRFGKPVRPSLFYPRGEDGALGEMKPREVIEAEKAQYEKDLAAWQQSEQGIAASEYEWKMRDTIRYSIVSLAGRDVAVAETEPLTTREAQDETKVREVLMPIVGQEFPQLGEAKLVKIDGNFPDYFWSSNTSQNLRRVDKLWRAKVSAVPILGDILKTTPLGAQEAAEHLKNHPSFKDRAVFYRCSTEFGIKRHDGVAVYPCDLLVMEMTDNGQRYVYDIVRMKKPTLTAMADLSAETLSQLYERHLTGESATSAPEGTADNIPHPSDEIKGDPESFARRSIVSRVIDGDAEERESALVAFVAERALRHGPKPNAIKTIARLGLEMGLKSVDTGRIVKKGEALAERVRGTVIEKAIRNGDVATATALLARESDIDRLVAGAAGQGGQLVRYGEGKIKSILDREIEKTVRSFNAASLADVERDTGIDIAGEILANSPEKFDPKGSAKRPEGEMPADGAADAEGSAPGGGAMDDANLSDYEIARRQRVRKEAEERVAKMIATAKERSEAAKKEREEWEAKREERKRKAEEAAASGDGGDGESGEGGGGESGGESGGGEGATPSDRPKLSTFADFKTPEEFAAFFRVWAEDRYKKEHGSSTLGKHEEKRLFPEFYRKAVVKELQDLADKLLPPKGARATVNRWLGEIKPGVKPDTLERISADVFAYINRNAIRESRTATIQKFRNGLQEFVKGPQFDDLKLDADRRVTGWVEEAARYIRRVCNLSIQSINGEPSQLERERAELQAILDRRSQVYDEEGKSAADAPKFDMETRRALAKLQLLEKYGAMKRYMPGEIADLADEAMRWLRDEAGKLEAAWKDAREAEESIRGALTAGIVGPNGQKYKRGNGVSSWFDGLFDSLNGMIRLRLQHLVRFADSAHQQKAKDAINRVVVMLGDGEVAFARHRQDDRMAFHKALNEIFTDRATGRFDRRSCHDWLNRMTEEIPADLSRQLSKQGYAEGMTYGQMLQLLVSLEQKSYAEAIKANGREGQADLIRTFETVGPDGRRERVLTDKDVLFIDWLRSFYEAKRGMLSEVTKRMTGLPINSPDPLYCPVKMYMGDQARGMHVDSSAAWDPIGSVFSRRVETLRDFDESASILGQFADRSAEAAKLVAWGERGSIIRGVFTNASVQESIRRAFGGGELTKILKQLEETFNGGENIKKAPGEIAAADKAMNWMTYLSLGYNPLSAMKQTTSFTVWANALPGGFKDLWRYMTDVDMATIKHIKESEAYKVRYGNEVGSGQDVATKGLFENPSENPVAAFFRKTSMGLLRKGDFLPGGWIAQGVFRDIYNRHLKEGMDADAADRLAMTETFNMLEETQQSGRTYNTAELAREHGRLGRLLVQFATSPLQQLQYETQAAREVRDLLRYKPSTPDADFEKRYSEAKGKLIRAAVVNHVLLPAALHAVTNLYRYAMGYDPEWEQEGWHWTMLRDIVLGQFSRVFFIGAISSVTWDTLITGKPMRDIPALIPAEGVVKLFGNVAVTARDVAKLDYEKVRKDLDRLLKSTSITRTPYDILRLATGTAYAEREERREKRRQKEAMQK